MTQQIPAGVNVPGTDNTHGEGEVPEPEKSRVCFAGRHEECYGCNCACGHRVRPAPGDTTDLRAEVERLRAGAVRVREQIREASQALDCSDPDGWATYQRLHYGPLRTLGTLLSENPHQDTQDPSRSDQQAHERAELLRMLTEAHDALAETRSERDALRAAVTDLRAEVQPLTTVAAAWLDNRLTDALDGKA